MDSMSPEPMLLGQSAKPWVAKMSAALEARGLAPAEGSLNPDPFQESPEDAAERRALKAHNLSARWRANLPIDYAKAALADLDAAKREVIQDYLARAMVPIGKDSQGEDLPAPTALTLMLTGDIGTGKTYAAYAIGHAAVAKGHWVQAWNVHDLLDDMRPDHDANAYRQASTCRLLILDDLGTGKVSDWATDRMYDLVNARVSNRLATVITTNTSAVILAEVWGKRTIDRLRSGIVPVQFHGESRRKAAW